MIKKDLHGWAEELFSNSLYSNYFAPSSYRRDSVKGHQSSMGKKVLGGITTAFNNASNDDVTGFLNSILKLREHYTDDEFFPCLIKKILKSLKFSPRRFIVFYADFKSIIAGHKPYGCRDEFLLNSVFKARFLTLDLLDELFPEKDFLNYCKFYGSKLAVEPSIRGTVKDNIEKSYRDSNKYLKSLASNPFIDDDLVDFIFLLNDEKTNSVLAKNKNIDKGKWEFFLENKSTRRNALRNSNHIKENFDSVLTDIKDNDEAVALCSNKLPLESIRQVASLHQDERIDVIIAKNPKIDETLQGELLSSNNPKIFSAAVGNSRGLSLDLLKEHFTLENAHKLSLNDFLSPLKHKKHHDAEGYFDYYIGLINDLSKSGDEYTIKGFVHNFIDNSEGEVKIYDKVAERLLTSALTNPKIKGKYFYYIYRLFFSPYYGCGYSYKKVFPNVTMDKIGLFSSEKMSKEILISSIHTMRTEEENEWAYGPLRYSPHINDAVEYLIDNFDRLVIKLNDELLKELDKLKAESGIALRFHSDIPKYLIPQVSTTETLDRKMVKSGLFTSHFCSVGWIRGIIDWIKHNVNVDHERLNKLKSSLDEIERPYSELEVIQDKETDKLRKTLADMSEKYYETVIELKDSIFERGDKKEGRKPTDLLLWRCDLRKLVDINDLENPILDILKISKEDEEKFENLINHPKVQFLFFENPEKFLTYKKDQEEAASMRNGFHVRAKSLGADIKKRLFNATLKTYFEVLSGCPFKLPAKSYKYDPEILTLTGKAIEGILSYIKKSFNEKMQFILNNIGDQIKEYPNFFPEVLSEKELDFEYPITLREGIYKEVIEPFELSLEKFAVVKF